MPALDQVHLADGELPLDVCSRAEGLPWVEASQQWRDRHYAAEWLLRLGDLRRVQEREEQEEREREEVGGPEPGEYDYDPDQGYARAVESDERWAECVEALFSAGAGGGD